MIIALEEYIQSGAPIADLCIVGAGAAGLELAAQLESTCKSILVLEAGFREFDFRAQKRCDFLQVGRKIRSADHQKYFDFNAAKKLECRIREYGGTLNSWGGRWKMLDPIDLEEKSYMPESGWPLQYSELENYYRMIAKDYEMEEFLQLKADQTLPSWIQKYSCFNPSIRVQELNPTNSKIKFHNQIEKSSTIRLILDATVVNIILSENHQKVKEVEVVSSQIPKTSLRARYFILACGSIENARLLLLSNQQQTKGIGNQNDLVGKNLIDHPKGIAGIFKPSTSNYLFPEFLSFQKGDKKWRIGFSLSEELLRKEQLPNHCMYLFPTEKKIHLKFFLEQLPNLESRLFLSNKKDDLGLFLPCIDWRFQDRDFLLFRRFIKKIQELLQINNLGEFLFDEQDFDMQFLGDASHQMGTTKMAKSAQKGVVDSDCKVFGLDNLFIAGSSVFPTSGNANPTFTILAMARRLAGHLKMITTY